MISSQEGPMERLLRGLDKHTELLSKEELIEELEADGIDTKKLLEDCHKITDEYLKKKTP